jgi:ABC-2 type transport system permease protein
VWSASGALARRALRDARTRTIAFAYLFAIYAYIQPAGFRHAYPTLADRLAFAHSFAGNDALRLFYGYPYDPVSVGGYARCGPRRTPVAWS